MLVSQTDVFLLLLTKDYVESEWCLKELRAAIMNKVKVVQVFLDLFLQDKFWKT